ncbi:hypothetical protein CHLRE_17g721350v5 [Chlamydomonas reinhardtii]|uniref:glutathione transferase n=1 Tax=Chlamydomonas reinhardtii TaxID=3055 RepID=A8J6F3_CHLRE|nr:uncharacterized protein CHLRE_17g721350v5 [Chlamydomonas reinhardtii]PNW70472.1 hypothetical protein CHLRE_17g721350v5 [Chlamydomonas reinhardtii]|eukprot:XP_001697204.1 predicted protein [Chlamydomonas reinhardtii]
MTIHKTNKPRVAEDGEYATATSTLPVLQYYPARGRAEPIRLVLAFAGQAWFEPPPDSIRQIQAIQRREWDGYPFRQLPRFIDEVHGEVDLVQGGAILRHLARKYDLYGGERGDLVAAARVDMMLDGVADLRVKLRDLVVSKQLAQAAVAEYTGSVLAPERELKEHGMMGPGLACLEYVLANSRFSEAGWFVGPRPSVVDFAAFDLVDLHLAQPQLEDAVRGRFPLLVEHHDRVAGLAGVREYLASDSRHEVVWPVDWIRSTPGAGSGAAGGNA